MWILNFIPDSWIVLAIHAVALLGLILFVVGFVSSRIPFITAYGNVIKTIGFFVLIAGIYFEGGIGVEMEWRNKVAQVEEKIKESKEKEVIINEVLVTKYKDRVKTITQEKQVVLEKIKEVEKVIDLNCDITSETIDILNQAAKKPIQK